MKRYIRIDLEYDTELLFYPTQGLIVNNINQIIAEDMPYLKVLFTRDCPDKEDLNRSVNHER